MQMITNLGLEAMAKLTADSRKHLSLAAGLTSCLSSAQYLIPSGCYTGAPQVKKPHEAECARQTIGRDGASGANWSGHVPFQTAAVLLEHIAAIWDFRPNISRSSEFSKLFKESRLLCETALFF